MERERKQLRRKGSSRESVGVLLNRPIALFFSGWILMSAASLTLGRRKLVFANAWRALLPEFPGRRRPSNWSKPVGFFHKPGYSTHNRPFVTTTLCYQTPPTATSIPSVFSNSSWESSDWAIHVAVAPQDAPVKTITAIQKALQAHYDSNTDRGPQKYTAEDLLRLGSAWYLPAEDMHDPYKKPSRLTLDQADFLLQEGDYLRIHYDPRRFPAVDLYDWTVSNTRTLTPKPKVVVHYDATKGFLVLNKPAECIPVHATVDNAAENLVACVKEANPDLDYITTPHRLDQNTSGLITVATSKWFAAYFAQGLRKKTAAQIPSTDRSSSRVEDVDQQSTGIHKVYRCLVCLMPPKSDGTTSDTNWSMEQALQELQSYAKQATVLRHYLEPSLRAPKRFLSTLPPDAILASDDATSPAGWAECLMRIRGVGDVCALRGNAASEALAKNLWSCSHELMPSTCQAVVEVEVELLTGRTHQIRGQLSASGYPLVNDLPYGGATPARSPRIHSPYTTIGRLALQCSRLEFLDPNVETIEKEKKGYINVNTKMVPSERWNKYQLDSAWWTPYLEEYRKSLTTTAEEDMTTMAALDIGLLDFRPPKPPPAVGSVELHPKTLPPQAMLSAGRNKYVLVKAIDPNTNEIYKWFVKSASPKECGGPYHKDVAQDLVEWIEACGYRAVVTGGGRILYNPESKRALVYGFSYGFGKGNHALAAKTIKEWSGGDIDSAYDDDPTLY